MEFLGIRGYRINISCSFLIFSWARGFLKLLAHRALLHVIDNSSITSATSSPITSIPAPNRFGVWLSAFRFALIPIVTPKKDDRRLSYVDYPIVFETSRSCHSLIELHFRFYFNVRIFLQPTTPCIFFRLLKLVNL